MPNDVLSGQSKCYIFFFRYWSAKNIEIMSRAKQFWDPQNVFNHCQSFGSKEEHCCPRDLWFCILLYFKVCAVGLVLYYISAHYWKSFIQFIIVPTNKFMNMWRKIFMNKTQRFFQLYLVFCVLIRELWY